MKMDESRTVDITEPGDRSETVSPAKVDDRIVDRWNARKRANKNVIRIDHIQPRTKVTTASQVTLMLLTPIRGGCVRYPRPHPRDWLLSIQFLTFRVTNSWKKLFSAFIQCIKQTWQMWHIMRGKDALQPSIWHTGYGHKCGCGWESVLNK